jgi:phage tail-like protein
MATISFTVPSYDWPAERLFDLWKMIPLINRQEDDAGTQELRGFVRCLQEIVDLKLTEIDRWTEIIDPDTAPEEYLDAMLMDLGNPFRFDLTETDKRRLIGVLMDMYRQKGTAIGIVNVIRFFLGLEAIVLAYLDEETWVLDESVLVEDETVQSGTDGVITASTRYFASATATFSTASIGGYITVSGSALVNDGEYEIVGYVDPITVVLGGTSTLADEASLIWEDTAFPCTLGPGDSWGRFAFEIDVRPLTLTDEQRDAITEIANYMKPAHTHLNRIVEAETPVVYDHLELGISELGGDEWDLHG